MLVLEQHGLIIGVSRSFATAFARRWLFDGSSHNKLFSGRFRSSGRAHLRGRFRNSDDNFLRWHFRSKDFDLLNGCLMDNFSRSLSHLFSGLRCRDQGLFHHALRLNNNLNRHRVIFHGVRCNVYHYFFTDNQRRIWFNYFFNWINRSGTFLDLGCLGWLYG